jgi:hypothetical protein
MSAYKSLEQIAAEAIAIHVDTEGMDAELLASIQEAVEFALDTLEDQWNNADFWQDLG